MCKGVDIIQEVKSIEVDTISGIRPFEFNVIMKLLHFISEWLNTRSLKNLDDIYDKKIRQGIVIAAISSYCNNRLGYSTKDFNVCKKIILPISSNVVDLDSPFKS